MRYKDLEDEFRARNGLIRVFEEAKRSRRERKLEG
ncbi:uncharacterized protein G2W53_021354 [Senna tora]|uniref:Uncharacterized protein n=1 Tax=Senna tora TaxID=362788 RepID=A0A834TLQ3_9FABA|nr:uncharacterized protein G2W53_021354 [Senna tora]